MTGDAAGSQPPNVSLGADCRLDQGVIVGYESGRELADPELVVGVGARLRSGTVLYAGSRIGERFETGHNVVVREQNEIGNDVQVWAGSVIDYGCHIGHRVKIHVGCYIAQFTILEDDVFLAPGVVLANDMYPGQKSEPKLVGPQIRRGAQIGINSSVRPGVEIGAGAMVGSGSVVVRDVPAGVVVAGNPARILKDVDALPR